MSISTIHQAIPAYEQVVNKCYAVVANTAANINKVALPAIAFFVLSNLPTADAGPVSYAVCVSACLSLATPALTPACLVSCIGLSGPWCP